MDTTAVKGLLAILQENPDLAGALKSDNPGEALAGIVAAAEENERQAKLNKFHARNMVKKTDPSGDEIQPTDAEIKKYVSKFADLAKFMKNNVKVKEVRPTSERWNVTIHTEYGRLTVALDSGVTDKDFQGPGRKA